MLIDPRQVHSPEILKKYLNERDNKLSAIFVHDDNLFNCKTLRIYDDDYLDFTIVADWVEEDFYLFVGVAQRELNDFQEIY